MELQRIGKYDLVAKIGEGAMGEVFKAHDPVLNRFVAVKTMSGLLAVDDDLVQRFRREAQSAARLNHLNIVTIFDFGDEQGKFYMAMELLEGEDLKDVIARSGLSDLWAKIDVMDQICDGLAYAHAQRVVHRDLKPANIRVLPNGRVKIMDFGLARLDTSDMTRTGMVMGTPNYMSPEQVRGHKADLRSDIFSLGAVFYELLSGHKAFSAKTMHSVLYKVLEEQPEPVLNWVPGLPAAFVALLDKALEKAPERRYQDANELRAAVRRVREALASGVESGQAEGDAAEATLYSGTEATLLHSTSPRLPTVAGANALDPQRAPRPARSRPPTLSGHAATHARAPASAPGSLSPPSRTGLYVVGALALVGTVVGGSFFALRNKETPAVTLRPVDLAQEQVGIMTEQLVGSRVELAQVNLENKDYRAAIAEAERALELDPLSAEALQVRERAQGVLKDLDTTAADARAAFARGDTARASGSLTRVLAIDPRHPVVAELSAALNQHFRSQAEEARGATLEARTAAIALKANALEGWADAERLMREADALARGEQFAVAAQKFLQSRDGFERARRLAVAAARPPSPRALPSLAPPTLVARLTPPPGTLPPYANTPPVTPPVVSQPPLTQAGAPPPAAGSSEEPAVRRVIAEYGRAIESRDLALFRQIKPNLSADDAKRLQDAFKAIKSHQVGIHIESVQVDGSQAVVRVTRQDTINGKPVQRVQQTFRLAQGAGGWTIVSLGQ